MPGDPGQGLKIGIVPEKSGHLAGLGSIQVFTKIDILIVF